MDKFNTFVFLSTQYMLSSYHFYITKKMGLFPLPQNTST